MEISVVSIILLAILNLLPSTAKKFKLQTPDKQSVVFEKLNDGLWYAPKADGEMFDGIGLKDGKLVDKKGIIIMEESYFMQKNEPIRWKEVDLIQDRDMKIKIDRKKKGFIISAGEAKDIKDLRQVFKVKYW